MYNFEKLYEVNNTEVVVSAEVYSRFVSIKATLLLKVIVLNAYFPRVGKNDCDASATYMYVNMSAFLQKVSNSAQKTHLCVICQLPTYGQAGSANTDESINYHHQHSKIKCDASLSEQFEILLPKLFFAQKTIMFMFR